MKAKWHHVALAVEDMDSSKEFYTKLLAFQIAWERENYSGEYFSKVVGIPDSSAHVVMLEGHGMRLELLQYHSPPGKRLPPRRQCDFGLSHIAFSVEEMQQLYEKLVHAGVQFNCPPQNVRPGVWATYMKDPEGNTVEIIEYQ